MCSSLAPDRLRESYPVRMGFALKKWPDAFCNSLVVNRRKDNKNKKDSKPSITETPRHDHHHLHHRYAEFALIKFYHCGQGVLI